MLPQRNACLAIAGVFAALSFLFLAPAWIRPDSFGIYAYLRSAVFDGDFAFFDEWAAAGMVRDGITLFTEVSPSGALANPHSIGTSILSAPPYLAARAIGGPGGGFFGLYGIVLAVTSAAFAAGAMMLARGFIDRHAVIAIAATIFGTPFFWQAFIFPLGTHMAGTLTIGLVLAALFSERDDRAGGLAAGLATGLAIATRLQHVMILPAVLYVALRRRRSGAWWLAAIAAGAIPIACQAVAWQAIYGTPLGPMARGATSAGMTWMPFHNVALGAVLFSSFHGLFAWSPVAILSILGWLAAARSPDARKRMLAVALLLMFAGEWIANGTFDRYFWGGMSFGARRFVDMAVPFAIGISWFVSTIQATLAMAMTAALSLWTVALMAAAQTHAISLSRYVSGAELMHAAVAPQTWRALAGVDWHSPMTSGALATQWLIAVAIVGALFALIVALRPGAAVWTALASIVLAVIIVVAVRTPARARASAQQLHIDTIASARAGALIDARTLLSDEVAWARARGDVGRVAATEKELRDIDATLRSLAESRRRSASAPSSTAPAPR